MSDAYEKLAQAATELATKLPQSAMQSLAKSVLDHGETCSTNRRDSIVKSLSNSSFRDYASDFLAAIAANADMPSEVVVAALLTASHSQEHHRDSHNVELVWTGPDSRSTSFRKTEQAILGVLDSARHRITLVSYAVYRIPRIRDALVRAAQRGVRINVIVETPDRLEGENEYDTLKALGADVAAHCSVYYWPLENRERDDNQKHGILHVKCAVADGERLYLSSANLTEYAFTINMELGILITGGQMPAQVERHFDKLIDSTVLNEV